MFNVPPPEMGPQLVAMALRDTRHHPVMGRAITILKGIDSNTHVAWKRALDQLESLCASDTTATASDVGAILLEARGSYLIDDDELTHFLRKAKKECLYVLSQKYPVRSWLTQCMARMFGVDAPSVPDENWWTTAREQIELGDDKRSFSLTDLAWRRLIEAGRHFESGGSHKKAKIGAKRVIKLVDKVYRRQKNEPIFDLITDITLDGQELSGLDSNF
ncbi:hypothetical protein N0V84_000933 [Fusarium piperis]|uniref:Uncharacterized protein n=1 Tax=Fusarium piperis TaxID=1435070 RepID=A0A9W8WLV5_9HYPO|nr:hypothetical protein N0V84_000933 [Fusarium piperis]